MTINSLAGARFIKSARSLADLADDSGREVAFAGRSNAGKSTAINALVGQKALARTSRTPGRTQLINLFGVGSDDDTRLIDLPGYGYAKVPEAMRKEWGRTLAEYFAHRQSLAGVVVIMDIRHPLKDTDRQMVDFALERELPVLCLLTKADKLSNNQIQKTIQQLRREPALMQVTWLPFSGVSKVGVPEARGIIVGWLGEVQPPPDNEGFHPA